MANLRRWLMVESRFRWRLDSQWCASAPSIPSDEVATGERRQCFLDVGSAAACHLNEIAGAGSAGKVRRLSAGGEFEEYAEFDFGEAWGDAGEVVKGAGSDSEWGGEMRKVGQTPGIIGRRVANFR